MSFSMILTWIVIAALVLLNLIAFLLMGIDKRKAVRDVRRIPEKTLLTACGLFAALGGLIGMYTFHHKTRKLKFKLGVPLMLIAQVAIVVCLFVFVL